MEFVGSTIGSGPVDPDSRWDCRRSVTWGSTWTLTSPWQLMSLKLCQAAMQLSDRYAVSNALSLDLCCCRLCSRLSWHVLTMAMQRVFAVFVFVTITCPCSSTTKCHVNLFVYNNNNNNATLTGGLSGRWLTARLQSVLHAAARLIYSKRKYEHITPLLRELHWLSVPERIQFKLAVLVFCCLHGTAPPYLADQL